MGPDSRLMEEEEEEEGEEIRLWWWWWWCSVVVVDSIDGLSLIKKKWLPTDQWTDEPTDGHTLL